MGSITTVTKLIGIERLCATQKMDSPYRLFEEMQDQALRSPANLPKSLKGKSTTSIHRLSVRNYYYYASSDQDQPTC
jgi:hypothetical protein